MAHSTRWKLIVGAGILLVVAWCYLPTGLSPEGGGWYTTYSSHFPESGGNITLYRRGPLRIRLRVDGRAYVMRFYPPDCILYAAGAEGGMIYAACGTRMPIPVAFFPPWKMHGQYEADTSGLRRTDTVRVVAGRAVATTMRVPIVAIRRAAESQSVLVPGWRLFSTAKLDDVKPVVRDEPVDVRGRGPRGTTALIDAVRIGQLDVIDALLRQGADVNASDSLGTTPLLMAVGVFEPDTAVVRRLLDGGADKNVPDSTTGATPLLHAAISKKTNVFRLLLERGADPCLRQKDGKAIVDYIDGPFPELQRMARAAFARCRP